MQPQRLKRSSERSEGSARGEKGADARRRRSGRPRR